MATLHLMVGLPCSGKTTAARRLEQKCGALRLTPDEWHLPLFGDDVGSAEHDRRHDTVERIMWDVARRTLELGGNVILDFGFWAREERDDFRARAAALGADFQIHYQEVSTDELLARLEERNRQAPPGVFIIPASEMRKYMKIFQPPVPEELC